VRDYLTLVKRLTWERDVRVSLCCASVKVWPRDWLRWHGVRDLVNESRAQYCWQGDAVCGRTVSHLIIVEER